MNELKLIGSNIQSYFISLFYYNGHNYKYDFFFLSSSFFSLERTLMVPVARFRSSVPQ